jgi:ferredoxin, 2Fe-2S
MPKVTFITADGTSQTIDHAHGSLMEVAVDHDIQGIEGACGGVCSCATCHVKIPVEWRDRVGLPNEAETDTMSFMDDVDETSRLSCQIDLDESLDGLTVYVPGQPD